MLLLLALQHVALLGSSSTFRYDDIIFAPKNIPSAAFAVQAVWK
jgi:hypothetical protein